MLALDIPARGEERSNEPAGRTQSDYHKGSRGNTQKIPDSHGDLGQPEDE